MVNEWTADDLPAVFPASYKPWAIDPGRRRDLAAWLNKHHPKPVSWGDAALADHLGRQAVAIDELQLDIEAAERERDRWRRAHSIAEGERDQAREQRDELQAKLDSLRVTYRNLDARANKIVERVAAAERERDQAREERDEAQMSERESQELRARMKELLDGVSNAVNPPEPPLVRWGKHDLPEKVREVVRDRDEWRARAEAAEARTAPAVSRADVAEVLSRCINPEMWNVTFPSVVNEVCDLFGIEAGQATDPIEKKARELCRAATPEARWETVADEYRRIARHVLGQEAKR